MTYDAVRDQQHIMSSCDSIHSAMNNALVFIYSRVVGVHLPDRWLQCSSLLQC